MSAANIWKTWSEEDKNAAIQLAREFDVTNINIIKMVATEEELNAPNPPVKLD
jgi:hypothetical protein